MSLLPVTATFALPLSAYYVFLQVRVTMKRIQTQTSLAPSSVKPASAGSKDDPLLPAFRTQANFAENVPLVLILAGLVELNGGNQQILATVMGVFTVARIMHGEFGLMVEGSGGIGRPIGFFSTLATILGLSAYGAYISSRHWLM